MWGKYVTLSREYMYIASLFSWKPLMRSIQASDDIILFKCHLTLR